MTAPDFAGAAFRAAMRGWRVYRLSPGSRVPLKGSHGYLDATRELDVVRLWWLDTPTANIGCAMGAATGAWILDVDRQHGGLLSLAELTAKNGALPVTLITRTPSGGFHHFWKWDADVPEIRNSVSRIGPGIDVIGAGGGVPIPPSVRGYRGEYSWVDPGAEIAEAPGWLVDLTRAPAGNRPTGGPKQGRRTATLTHESETEGRTATVRHAGQGDVDRYVAAAAASELTALESAQPGTRNHALNRAAFNIAQLVKADALPEGWARGQLERRAIVIGLSLAEARGTIDSAFRAAQPRELPR